LLFLVEKFVKLDGQDWDDKGEDDSQKQGEGRNGDGRDKAGERAEEGENLEAEGEDEGEKKEEILGLGEASPARLEDAARSEGVGPLHDDEGDEGESVGLCVGEEVASGIINREGDGGHGDGNDDDAFDDEARKEGGVVAFGFLTQEAGFGGLETDGDNHNGVGYEVDPEDLDGEEELGTADEQGADEREDFAGVG